MGVPRAMLPEGRLSGNKVKLGDLTWEELFGPSLGDSGKTCFPAFSSIPVTLFQPHVLPTPAFGKESESKRPAHNEMLVCYYSRLTHSPPTHITFTLQ